MLQIIKVRIKHPMMVPYRKKRESLLNENNFFIFSAGTMVSKRKTQDKMITLIRKNFFDDCPAATVYIGERLLKG
jgi:hypothetical protein